MSDNRRTSASKRAMLSWMQASPLYTATCPSPLGQLVALADGEGRLVALGFGALPASVAQALKAGDTPSIEDRRPFVSIFEQLDAYFGGDLRRFAVRTAAAGSDFQRRAWAALSDIPYGDTVSYGELAQLSGRPNAARAIGSACRTNPIAIVVPCHRVIGASGSLTGYAGGMDRKRALLSLEGVMPAPLAAPSPI